MPAGALWCDMNSVAPGTKRAAARAIEAAGGRYVDVAVMAPVDPARSAVPLLLSGPHAEAGAAALAAVGFTRLRVVPGDVGRASSIKMIRSVMVKGIEALSAECALAAEEAGVLDEVVASLDASWPGADWARRFDYNLDRMLVHGTRRAAEMEEVVKTLDALGTGSAMTRGTVERQRAAGALGHGAPTGLIDKLQHMLGRDRSNAA
jgi:3-hydroxyisobutyrate dehydrogenase-like beta-hydroxyacid dehydrogenase